MKQILILFFLLFCLAKINATTYYSRATGDWTTGAIWSTTSGGAAATATILSTDDVVIQSGNVITVSADAVCNNLTVANTTNSITVNASVTLIVNGQLNCSTTSPTTDVVGGLGTIKFTGATNTNILGSNWSASQIFCNITFDHGTSDTIYSGTANLKLDAGTMTVISPTILKLGTVTTLNSEIRGTTNAVLTINQGATVVTSNPIRSSSTSTTYFPTVNINGTLIMNTSYLNATTLTIGSTGLLSTSYIGTQGWWNTTTVPTTLTLNSGSTVKYTGTANQIIAATTYSNLNISNIVSCTLVGSTTVNGNLNINYGTLITGTNNLTLGSNASANIYPSGSLSINNVSSTINFNSRPVRIKSSWTSKTLTTANSNVSVSTIISVPSTDGLFPGAAVSVSSGIGAFAANSIVTNIIDGTTFSVNNFPTTPLSNATISFTQNTGKIGTIVGTLNNATNVTIERYIPGGKRAYRFLSHPFNASIALNQMTGAGEIDITGAGGATNGFTTTITNNPSAFAYNTANANSTSSPDPGWEAFADATTASWSSKQGIRVLVRGTKGEGLDGNSYTPSATTISMTGALNDGTSPTFTLASSTNSNYNLIGNPLASPIDLSLTTRGSAVSSSFYVWDPQVSNAGNKGTYVTLPFTSSYILPIGSAFFAQTSDGAANNTIQFTESCKSTSTPASLFRGISTFGANSLNLELTDSIGYADRLLVFFDKNQCSSNKEWWDAEKMINPDVNFYSMSADNYNLSIDARPFPTVGGADMIIPVKIYSTTAKTLILTAKDFDIQDSRDVLLHDKYTGTWTILNKDVQYSFTVTTDALTQGNRFEIVMRGNSSLPVNILNVSASQKNAGIEVNWNTAAESNLDSYEVEESANATTFIKAATVAAKNGATNTYTWFDATVNNGDNYYRIKAVEKNGTVKYSNVVKVKIGGKNAEFTVYPNPVKDGIVSLQMSNVEKGVYTVKIFNNAGQEVANRKITSNDGSTTETITLGKGIAKGNYKMQITNGTTSITKSVIVD